MPPQPACQKARRGTLGIGRGHTGTLVLLLIHNRDVSVSNTNTGEILAEFTIDPNRDYQCKRP